MTRRVAAIVALAMIAGLISLDLASSEAPDPFAAPPLFALGSGQGASGAHCAALPQ